MDGKKFQKIGTYQIYQYIFTLGVMTSCVKCFSTDMTRTTDDTLTIDTTNSLGEVIADCARSQTHLDEQKLSLGTSPTRTRRHVNICGRHNDVETVSVYIVYCLIEMDICHILLCIKCHLYYFNTHISLFLFFLLSTHHHPPADLL